MAFTQTAHSLDPAKPGASLMSVTNERVKRAIVPISAAMTRREYVPAYTWDGGGRGDDVSVAETNVLVDDRAIGDYGPRNQAEKATLIGVPMAVDITSPRGWIDPNEPYGAAPVSPADDPTITSLVPATGVSGVTPIWVKITGTKFTQWSTVETGNVGTPYSKYVSPTRIDVLMDPRSTPGVISVKVIDHGVKSAGSDFTFT